MKEVNKTQEYQEKLYNFPYHYIPTLFGRRFSQIRTLTWGYEYLSYTFFVINILKKIKINSLLDIGCGDGRFLFEMSQLFPETNLVGLDYSKRAIMLAKAMNPHINYKHGDLLSNKILFDEKFEIITLINTLEHIPPKDINPFIEKISSYLKQNGEFIIMVPSKNVPVNRKHFQHFDFDSLVKILNPFFSIKEKYYLNKNSKFTNRFYKLFSNNLYTIRVQSLWDFFYHFYEKRFLYSNRKNARRICLFCEKKRNRE